MWHNWLGIVGKFCCCCFRRKRAETDIPTYGTIGPWYREEEALLRTDTYAESFRVPLNPTSLKYQEIEAKLQGRRVTSIEQISCTKMYAAFEEEKEELKARRRQQIESGTAAESLNLFHGTSLASALSIIDNGFKKEFAGRNIGTIYGQGVYFSPIAETALLYAFPDPTTGERVLLLCDVLVGLYTRGNSNMTMPPRIPGHPSIHTVDSLYDSTVDSEFNPTVYVSCYKGDHYALPKFLITLQM